MAKKRRSAKQRAAFARMIAGLRRYKRGAGRRVTRFKSRAARGLVRRRRIGARPRTARRIRLRNPLAVLANPSWVPAIYGGDSAGRRRKRRRKGATSMAKRRKRRAGKRRARRASPRRTHHRRARARRPVTRRRRRSHGRRASYARRVPRGTRVIYLNPRKRRGRRRHRRNGGFGMRGIARRVFVPYAAGFLASMGAVVLDASLSSYPSVRQLSKVAGAVAIAVFGRRYPVASAAAIGALAGSQGYTLGTRLAGGMVAHTPAEAVKGLGEMQQTYPELGALLNGGVGALLNGLGAPDDVDNVAVNYATALNNMADSDD